MTTKTYMKNNHPVGSDHYKRRERLLIEATNHRAIVAQTNPLPDGRWYNPVRRNNSKNCFISEIKSAIGHLTSACRHVDNDEATFYEILGVRQALTLAVNQVIKEKGGIPVEPGNEFNMVKDKTEQVPAFMREAVRELIKAYEHAKDFDANMVPLIQKIHADAMQLFAPDPGAVDNYALDHDPIDTYIDVAWTPKPDEWKRGRRSP